MWIFDCVLDCVLNELFLCYNNSYFIHYGAINIDPETMGGTPVFTGTRVSIQSLFDYIETGETLDEFLKNFPSVKKELAIQVLEMASSTITTEKEKTMSPKVLKRMGKIKLPPRFRLQKRIR